MSRLLLAALALAAVAVAALAVTLAVVATSEKTESADRLAVSRPPGPILVSDPPDTASGPASGESASHRVVYGESGFEPNRIEIAAGDAVLFVNSSEEYFWPASNIHPTHEILPEFDPERPLEPGSSWTHRFDKPGQWYYHNHLSPDEGGLVSVSPSPGTESGRDQALASASGRQAPLVFEMPDREFAPVPQDAAASHVGIYTDDRELEAFIERFGPGAALQVLKQIELESGSDCHNRAHEAGRIAYEKFGPAAFALASHDCQSGGQHGATEALFAERGTANLAADIAALCDSTHNTFFRHQCVHGVGHGLMAWTNYDLPGALGLCDHAPRLDRFSCYSGVYMENVVGGLSGAMGHITEYLREGDPIYPCNIVEARYQPYCYFYQTTRMADVLNWNMAAVAALCDAAPANARSLCFRSYGRDAANLAADDPAETIGHCRHAAASADNADCIREAAQNGFWEPVGADRAVEFCAMLDADPTAYPQSRDSCYWSIQQQAGYVLVTPEERWAFCEKLPANRQAGCVL
ncbi:MAG: hypothetical protein OXG30_06620 [bacterium]|nr:hypothetical protein [bacterium]